MRNFVYATSYNPKKNHHTLRSEFTITIPSYDNGMTVQNTFRIDKYESQ